MPVVGVLARAGTPDDSAVFVDIKTAWVIAGIGHGHTDLTDPSSRAMSPNAARMESLPTRPSSPTTRSPRRISDLPLPLHTAELPMTSIIAAPHSEKDRTLSKWAIQRRGELPSCSCPRKSSRSSWGSSSSQALLRCSFLLVLVSHGALRRPGDSPLAAHPQGGESDDVPYRLRPADHLLDPGGRTRHRSQCSPPPWRGCLAAGDRRWPPGCSSRRRGENWGT